MCGLRIDVDGDRVTRVRPDDDGVWSRDYVCPKGATPHLVDVPSGNAVVNGIPVTAVPVAAA